MLDLIRAPHDPQCPSCGWPASAHAPLGDGTDPCPSPPREVCGHCDAMLPMACTCIDPPGADRA